MDFLLSIWFIGSITAWLLMIVVGLSESVHTKYFFKSWGAYRFYTLAIPASVIIAPAWPFLLLYLWIVGLIKGK